ncbi:MAG: diacylglycerol kinase family lipid kinase [Anaerolineae bacterium]|nr:diacylglycerol kinase family lipid kinase [Anaerolineae bacterium]
MKICLIINPKAGPSTFKKQLKKAEDYLLNLGCEVKRLETTGPGDAIRLAQQAAEEKFDTAVAIGGDGTVNEVCNGLVGTDTALGVLPAGTANVFAAEMGIPIWNPLNPDAVVKAASIIATGQRRKIDLGRLQLDDGTSRYFLMWCGVGLDAAISQSKKTNNKPRPLGYASWIISGLITIYEFLGTPAILTTDNGPIRKRLIVAVVSNGQLYGRVWRLAPHAKMDDGLLDVAVMTGHRWPSVVKHLLGVTFRRHVKDPDFFLYKTSKLALSSKTPLPVHVDAETIGTTPVEVEVVPSSLNVVIPTNAPANLFEQKGTPDYEEAPTS